MATQSQLEDDRRATTVDVWDTLIRRRCHPDEVKLAAARFVRVSYCSLIKHDCRSDLALYERRRAAEVTIGNRTRAEGYDDEYGLRETWQLAFEQILLAPGAVDLARLVAETVRFELEFEERVTYPDDGVVAALQSGPGLDNLHILSDFYVGTTELLALVRKKHPDVTFRGGLVSCDAKVNKRSGRLFRKFQSLEKVSASNHFHVGDNLQSDVVKAREAGAQALHYVNKPEEDKRAALNRQFSERMAGDLSSYWALLQGCIDELRTSDSRAVDARFRLGCQLSPLYVSYVLWAIERASELGTDCVYYFTREGEVLAKLHACIAAALPHVRMPRAEVLEVSRLATFGASIERISLKELGRFWTMYPRHSMRTLFTSLGLEADRYATSVEAAGLGLDEQLSLPWQDKRFLALLDDFAFRNAVDGQLAERRDLLRAYLAGKGITDSTRRAVIVDIGWRGTIHDNIARVLPTVHWHGAYLGLFRFLNAQPSNVTKEAFLYNDNHGDGGERALRPQAPLEMLFNSNSGSVLGYARFGTAVIALRQREPGEDRVFESFTAAVQDAVLFAAPALARWLDTRALAPEELRHEVRTLVSALLAEPPREFARAYFVLEHNETFGVGGFVKQDAGVLQALVKAGSPRKALGALAQKTKNSGWAPGYLAAHPIAEVSQLVSQLDSGRRDARRAYKLVGRIAREVWSASKHRGVVPVLVDVKDSLVRKPQATGGPPSMLPLVGAADLSDARLRNFNALHAEVRARAAGPFVVAWIFPDIGLGSGGHMTLLRFVRHFRSLGIVNRVYIHGRSRLKTRGELRAFIEAHYGSLDGIEVFESSQAIHESDVLIATHWSTAYDVYRSTNTRFKAYFIQDFEPHFYARGSMSVFAENTYSMNMYGICASPWLHQLTTTRYGMSACSFHLGYEPHTYYLDPLVERDLNRIVVYMRPSTERRGTELLLAALVLVQKRRPQTRISIFGTSSIPTVGLRAEMLGLLNEEQLRRLHSGSAITLLTSLTNYSLMPIEAMACGSVVVDVDVESMRATFEEGAPIVLARPEPVAIADSLIALLESRDRLIQLSEASLYYASRFRWKVAFESVVDSLFQQYFDGSGPRPRALADNTAVRGVGGSQIFLVADGKRSPVDCLQTLSELGLTVEDVKEISVRALLAIPPEQAAVGTPT